MKLITAIVNKKDVNEVSDALREKGFSFTRMASTGGFLTAGNTTLLIGTEDEKLEIALETIREHCKKRTVHVAHSPYTATGFTMAYPTEVAVGGATVFVTEVCHYEKM